jgi:hypothetical protein
MATERMAQWAAKYFTGSKSQVRWRLHKEAKKKLERHGHGPWSALPPDKWAQAEREYSEVLSKRISEGKPVDEKRLRQIRGGIITAIKRAGGIHQWPGYVRRYSKNYWLYGGRVMKAIAMGNLQPPKGMR